MATAVASTANLMHHDTPGRGDVNAGVMPETDHQPGQSK
jgi:hypothetical protein